MTTMKRSLTSWLSWPSWKSGRARPAPERRRSEDCADYGTAFGLDMSFGPQTADTLPQGDQDRRDRQRPAPEGLADPGPVCRPASADLGSGPARLDMEAGQRAHP